MRDVYVIIVFIDPPSADKKEVKELQEAQEIPRQHNMRAVGQSIIVAKVYKTRHFPYLTPQ